MCFLSLVCGRATLVPLLLARNLSATMQVSEELLERCGLSIAREIIYSKWFKSLQDLCGVLYLACWMLIRSKLHGDKCMYAQICCSCFKWSGDGGSPNCPKRCELDGKGWALDFYEEEEEEQLRYEKDKGIETGDWDWLIPNDPIYNYEWCVANCNVSKVSWQLEVMLRYLLCLKASTTWVATVRYWVLLVCGWSDW